MHINYFINILSSFPSSDEDRVVRQCLALDDLRFFRLLLLSLLVIQFKSDLLVSLLTNVYLTTSSKNNSPTFDLVFLNTKKIFINVPNKYPSIV
jgi:hypothetical protein